MTTSTQLSVLSTKEIDCLRAVARGDARFDVDVATALLSKGMLAAPENNALELTPAGHHAIHVDGPGALPDIDG